MLNNLAHNSSVFFLFVVIVELYTEKSFVYLSRGGASGLQSRKSITKDWLFFSTYYRNMDKFGFHVLDVWGWLHFTSLLLSSSSLGFLNSNGNMPNMHPNVTPNTRPKLAALREHVMSICMGDNLGGLKPILFASLST